MENPPKPENEALRLRSLKKLAILDTPAEERFDRITRLARKSLNTKISIISLVDADRQWFKSVQGLTESQTPRDISFCGHAILDEEAFVVSDASQDDRFVDNPLVTGGPGIRLYAGQPIHSPDGQRIGTLCVIDSKPRELSPDEELLLKDLAILVENEVKVEELNKSELELRKQLTEAERRASIDSLTRIWNRAAIMKLLDLEIQRAARAQKDIAVAMIDIDHFKKINDTHGHAVGDVALAATAERIRSALRTYDSVGRYGGEEFLAVINSAEFDTAMSVGERIRKRVAYSLVEFSTGRLDVTTSIGICSAPAQDVTDSNRLIASADKALYEAKSKGRNRVEVCSEESASSLKSH